MKGYKIGFSEIDDGKDLRFALIKLDIPEGYPGLIIRAPDSQDFRSNVARVLSINKIEMRPELTLRYYTRGVIYSFAASDEIMDHAFSIYDNNFYYHPGEIIFPDKFDDADYRICTNGIHFFRSQNDALLYINSKWVWYRFDQCKQYKAYMLAKKGADF